MFCRAEQANNEGRRSVQWSVRDDLEGFSEKKVRHDKLCRKHVGSRDISDDCTQAIILS